MKRLLLPFAVLLLFGAGCTDSVPSPKPRPIPPPVPGGGTTGTPCNDPGDTRCATGYECSQECGPPVVRDTDPSPGYSCYPKGEQRMCPICLASNTRMATPNGEINVTKLFPGMKVWSLDAHGKRVAANILRVSKTATPKNHQVVHLILTDGRTLWVSPNHPAADGRLVGQMKAGDRYDGSIVRSAELVAYWDNATYDLLVDSSSGFYWANGVLLNSTLKR